MGTNAVVSIRLADGDYRSILVNGDGYIDTLGENLKEFYNTEEKVAALLDEGDLSSVLGPEPDHYRDGYVVPAVITHSPFEHDGADFSSYFYIFENNKLKEMDEHYR